MFRNGRPVFRAYSPSSVLQMQRSFQLFTNGEKPIRSTRLWLRNFRILMPCYEQIKLNGIAKLSSLPDLVDDCISIAVVACPTPRKCRKLELWCNRRKYFFDSI